MAAVGHLRTAWAALVDAERTTPASRTQQTIRQVKNLLRRLHAAGNGGRGAPLVIMDPGRRNVATPLLRSLDGGTGLPRLDTSRMRATWLADCAGQIGLATFMHAAGITCSQRLGDLLATLKPAGEAAGRRAVNSALAALEKIIDDSRAAPRVDALLPIGVRHRQLPVRTLLLGMALTLADHRPAHLTRVHDTLTSLPAGDQVRPGVIAGWKSGPHLLT